MTALSIKSMLHAASTGQAKSWAHDRLTTVGASEVGQCIRKTWFTKQATEDDADYVNGYGARLRGDLIEQHYWEPGIRSQLPEGVQLLYAGSEQQTLVDGYLSATSDGLLVGVDRDCLSWLDVPDIGSDCLVIECKSIDPRVDLKTAKAENVFQVHCQIGLIRHCTPYQPQYGLISYTDASFLDNVTEFAVKFDPTIYAAAKSRALQVMTATDPLQLKPEGKITGAGECEYCPFKSRCTEAQVNGIPKLELPLISDNVIKAMQPLVTEAEQAKREEEDAHRRRAEAIEKLKEIMRANSARKAVGPGWTLNWHQRRGRKVLDRKALEASGLDLSGFEVEGDPVEVFLIK